MGQVKKRWKDIKSAVIDRQWRCATTGVGGPLPEVPYEDMIRQIIRETTNLVNVPASCKVDAFFLALVPLQIILLKLIE